jgi:hypothetical protein
MINRKGAAEKVAIEVLQEYLQDESITQEEYDYIIAE